MAHFEHATAPPRRSGRLPPPRTPSERRATGAALRAAGKMKKAHPWGSKTPLFLIQSNRRGALAVAGGRSPAAAASAPKPDAPAQGRGAGVGSSSRAHRSPGREAGPEGPASLRRGPAGPPGCAAWRRLPVAPLPDKAVTRCAKGWVTPVAHRKKASRPPWRPYRVASPVEGVGVGWGGPLTEADRRGLPGTTAPPHRSAAVELLTGAHPTSLLPGKTLRSLSHVHRFPFPLPQDAQTP